jgi:hypothetical protein
MPDHHALGRSRRVSLVSPGASREADMLTPTQGARRRTWFLISLGLSVVVFLGDYLSGWEVSFSTFYLIPISMAAWFLGARASLILAALSTLSGLGPTS